MNIQASETRQIENRLGKKLTIGGDDDQFRLKLSELFNECSIASAGWLQHRHTGAAGDLLDGSRLKLEIATLWLVRLRDDSEDAKRRLLAEGLKAGARQLCRAHEDDFQRRHSSGGLTDDDRCA